MIPDPIQRKTHIAEIRKAAKQKRHAAFKAEISASLKKQERKVRRLKKQFAELVKDIRGIQQEHDSYTFKGSADEAVNWLESFPIETLRQSLEHDHSLPTSNYSLNKFKHKTKLYKLHTEYLSKLEAVREQLAIEQIDLLLLKVKSI